MPTSEWHQRVLGFKHKGPLPLTWDLVSIQDQLGMGIRRNHISLCTLINLTTHKMLHHTRINPSNRHSIGLMLQVNLKLLINLRDLNKLKCQTSSTVLNLRDLIHNRVRNLKDRIRLNLISSKISLDLKDHSSKPLVGLQESIVSLQISSKVRLLAMHARINLY
jgi:hypothetical protein